MKALYLAVIIVISPWLGCDRKGESHDLGKAAELNRSKPQEVVTPKRPQPTCKDMCARYVECEVAASGESLERATRTPQYEETISGCLRECREMKAAEVACWHGKSCRRIRPAMFGDRCPPGDVLSREQEEAIVSALAKGDAAPYRLRPQEIQALAQSFSDNPASARWPDLAHRIANEEDEFEQRRLIREEVPDRLGELMNRWKKILNRRLRVAVPVRISYDFEKFRWQIAIDLDADLASSPFEWSSLSDETSRSHFIPMKEDDAAPLSKIIKSIKFMDIEFTRVPLKRVFFWIANERDGLSISSVRFCNRLPKEQDGGPPCSPWNPGLAENFKATLLADWSQPTCQQLALCVVEGRCSLVDGECIADSTPDCKESGHCGLYGQCISENGYCTATNSNDCTKAELCKKRECMLVHGRCAPIGIKHLERLVKIRDLRGKN